TGASPGAGPIASTSAAKAAVSAAPSSSSRRGERRRMSARLAAAELIRATLSSQVSLSAAPSHTSTIRGARHPPRSWSAIVIERAHVIGSGRVGSAIAARLRARAAEALAVARELAETLGLRPFELADEHRTLYHAGAVFASNYLVTLQRAAVRLGVPAEGLVPLMQGTIEHGFELTGPIARGDWETV